MFDNLFTQFACGLGWLDRRDDCFADPDSLDQLDAP